MKAKGKSLSEIKSTPGGHIYLKDLVAYSKNKAPGILGPHGQVANEVGKLPTKTKLPKKAKLEIESHLKSCKQCDKKLDDVYGGRVIVETFMALIAGA